MTTRLLLAFAATILLGVTGLAEASSITYDFSGEFAGSGLNGIRQFNGSFTINGDPTVNSLSGFPSVSESGSEVSITLKAGGQVFEYANQSNPAAVASFSVGVSPSWSLYPGASASDPSGLPYDEAIIHGAISGGNTPSSFFMSIYNYDPAMVDQLGNLRNFALPAGNASIYVTTGLDSGSAASGATINSIELVTTPEPSTLVIFAVIGTLAIRFRRRQSCNRLVSVLG